MSIIEGVIPPASFEIIRDRIGAILTDEIKNQATLSNDSEINAVVHIERFIPFDKTELPAINIMVARGNFEPQSVIQTNGTYLYNIDVYTRAKSDVAIKADSLSMFRLHRLLGIIRSILENSKYLTLGFARPFIVSRKVVDLSVHDPDSKDALSSVMGRLTFEVKAPERGELVEPRNFQGFDTRAKLNLGANGYYYSSSQ
jgi:hypothetical protein